MPWNPRLRTIAHNGSHVEPRNRNRSRYAAPPMASTLRTPSRFSIQPSMAIMTISVTCPMVMAGPTSALASPRSLKWLAVCMKKMLWMQAISSAAAINTRKLR